MFVLDFANAKISALSSLVNVADSPVVPTRTIPSVPALECVDLLPSTIEKLIEIETITGIKEAVDSKERFSALNKIKDKRSDFKLYSGDDPSFVKFMKFKGDGVISVAANIIPKEMKELSDLCLAGNFFEAEKVIKNYKEIFKLLFIEAVNTYLKNCLY